MSITRSHLTSSTPSALLYTIAPRKNQDSLSSPRRVPKNVEIYRGDQKFMMGTIHHRFNLLFLDHQHVGTTIDFYIFGIAKYCPNTIVSYLKMRTDHLPFRTLM